MGTRSGYKRGWYSRSIYYSQQARRNDFPLEYRKIFTLDNFSLGFLLTWIRLYRKRVSDILMLCAIFAIEMILYKYYPCSKYTLTSLAVNGLWCHYATMMNDPFECLWTIDRQFTEELLNEFKGYSRQAKSQTLNRLSTLDDLKLTEFINKLRRDSVKKFAFSSLSEDPYDILMWSHYADSHKGIAVGFEFDEFDNGNVFQKVTYDDKLGDYDLLSWAKFMDGDDALMTKFLEDISIKSNAWAREKEWRIWRNNPCYYNYKDQEIKEINFGINCTNETKTIIRKVVQFHDNLTLFEMETSNNPFKLVR